MRWHRFHAALALIFLAGALAAANVWFAAERCMFSFKLDGEVVAMEVRHEKHPPKDDVCLVEIEPGGAFHIEHHIYDDIQWGDRLKKERWSRMIEINGETLEIGWSADLRGMWGAMPLVVAMVVAAVFLGPR